MESKSVSIIIPTYMDWERLALCVAALSRQTYPKNRFEVIIVNNNPDDTAPEHFLLPENYKIIAEKKTGSYAARNAGLKIAAGEIIGFTDSDCIPDPNWIKHAVDYFQNNTACSRIAGAVSVFPKTSKATVAEKYDKLYSFRQKRYVTDHGTCVTANLFAYRYVFNDVGGFNANQMSFGDLYWGIEAHKAGYRIDYVDNVIVNHPARDWQELKKKERRLAGGIGLRERDNKPISIFKMLNEYRPRLAEFKFVYSDGKYLNGVDKIKVLLIRHYLLGIRAYEKFRVQMGKNPNRS